MPPSTISAPIAMMIAELPLNPLPLPALVAVLIVGTAGVVEVGIETLGCGKPGERGLLPCPPSGGVAAVAAGAAVLAADEDAAAAVHDAAAAVDDAAIAADGSTSAAPRSAPRTARNLLNTAYASGRSIAGVSGAAT